MPSPAAPETRGTPGTYGDVMGTQLQLLKQLTKDWYKLAREAPIVFSLCTTAPPKPLCNIWTLGLMENLATELLTKYFRKLLALLILPLTVRVGILANTCSLLFRQTDANAAHHQTRENLGGRLGKT